MSRPRKGQWLRARYGCEMPICHICEEPWCKRCKVHWSECDCPSAMSDERDYEFKEIKGFLYARRIDAKPSSTLS